MTGKRVPVRQRRVARKLRQWRDQADLTLDVVTTRLSWSVNKLHRYETAKTMPGPAEVIALATVYGIGEDERDRTTNLVFSSLSDRDQGLWSSYTTNTVPDYVRDYLETEAEASSVTDVESVAVPGLLQSPDYTDALVRAWSSDEHIIEQRRALRQQRQDRLDDTTRPLRLHSILYEAVLTNRVGDSELMREQLDFLCQRATQSNVTVQVLPFELGAYPGFGASYHVLRFDDDDEGAVYLENLGSGLYIEDDNQVEPYILNAERLSSLALTPEASLDRIKATREGQ